MCYNTPIFHFHASLNDEDYHKFNYQISIMCLLGECYCYLLGHSTKTLWFISKDVTGYTWQ